MGIGFSAHSVPSLSNVAMRSSGGMYPSEPGSLTVSTNSVIALTAGVSFQLPSRSVALITNLLPNHAPEPDVRGGRVDRLALPGRRPVPEAVARSAEMRAALDHPSGYGGAGLAGDERVLGRGDPW